MVFQIVDTGGIYWQHYYYYYSIIFKLSGWNFGKTSKQGMYHGEIDVAPRSFGHTRKNFHKPG